MRQSEIGFDSLPHFERRVFNKRKRLALHTLMRRSFGGFAAF
jgi:hypothetical protein